MNRPPYYIARCGIVYSPTTAYTVREAEEHAHHFLDGLMTRPCEAWSMEWGCKQLAQLVTAIRQAKEQAAARPVTAEPEQRAA